MPSKTDSSMVLGINERFTAKRVNVRKSESRSLSGIGIRKRADETDLNHLRITSKTNSALNKHHRAFIIIRLTVFSSSVASALRFAPLASRWCVLSASQPANSGGLITGFLWPPAFREFFFSQGPGDWSGLWSRLRSEGTNVDLSTSSPLRTQFHSKTRKINVGGLKRAGTHRPLRLFVDYPRKYFWLVPEETSTNNVHSYTLSIEVDGEWIRIRQSFQSSYHFLKLNVLKVEYTKQNFHWCMVCEYSTKSEITTLRKSALNCPSEVKFVDVFLTIFVSDFAALTHKIKFWYIHTRNMKYDLWKHDFYIIF